MLPIIGCIYIWDNHNELLKHLHTLEMESLVNFILSQITLSIDYPIDFLYQ